MGTTGIILGVALLLVVVAVALLLARKANEGVKQFREEQHENFVGRKNP